jgi:hypothetical protein
MVAIVCLLVGCAAAHLCKPRDPRKGAGPRDVFINGRWKRH